MDAVVATPEMSRKIEELVDLVIGSLPRYKISRVTFAVTITTEPLEPGDEPRVRRVLLTARPLANLEPHERQALETNQARPQN